MKLCHFEVGPDKPFFLLSGPCVVESEKLTTEIAISLKEMTDELGIPFIFKASFDKANRSSHNSYRGPGIEEGLRILEQIKKDLNVPIVTDVHEDTPLD
ncbi:MAG: 2-dehydro-3-deoxyphosphooctonate aldolase (KDO 8-P synthase), partial [Cocleimonas sp.]